MGQLVRAGGEGRGEGGGRSQNVIVVGGYCTRFLWCTLEVTRYLYSE